MRSHHVKNVQPMVLSLAVILTMGIPSATFAGKGAVSAEARSQEGEPAGPEERKTWDVEDAWITTKVKMALLLDDVVDGLAINVDTFDGRVTLHGTVESDAAKERAERQAREVDGIRDVRNLLRVEALEGRADEKWEAVSNKDLEQRVSAELYRRPRLRESGIAVVAVDDGTVVLDGTVASTDVHRRAIEVVRGIEGVERVESRVTDPGELTDGDVWSDGSTEEVADSWITTKAKVALFAESGLSPFDVNVDTRDGAVTLFGMVETMDAKMKAERAVSALAGVVAVRNELQVVPDAREDVIEERDEDVQEEISDRLEDREILDDADIEVGVADGVVRLTGSVSSQRARLTALTIARSTTGVQAVIDDLVVDGEVN